MVFADAVLSDAADFGVVHRLFRGSTLVCQQASTCTAGAGR